MSRYQLRKLPNKDSKYDDNEIIHEATCTSLDEMLEVYEAFLRGCGFHFTGQLTIEEDEPPKEETHDDEEYEQVGDEAP